MSAEQIKAWRQAIAEHKRQQRRQRRKRPGSLITGIRIPPPGDDGAVTREASRPQYGRCPERACPWRSPGPDRRCPEHSADHGTGDLAAAAKALGIELAPGDRGDGADAA